MEIRIFLADNHPICLEGLASILSKQVGIKVVGQATTVEDAIVGIKKHNPDVTVINVSTGGIRTKQIMSEIGDSTTKILPISSEVEGDLVLIALQNGAHGFMPLGVTERELRDAITRIHAGEHVIHPTVQGLIAEAVRRAEVDGRTPHLSKRESQIISLAAEGKTMKVIGEELNISTNTVKVHLRNIYEKLEVTDRTSAVTKAIRLGIITTI